MTFDGTKILNNKDQALARFMKAIEGDLNQLDGQWKIVVTDLAKHVFVEGYERAVCDMLALAGGQCAPE